MGTPAKLQDLPGYAPPPPTGVQGPEHLEGYMPPVKATVMAPVQASVMTPVKRPPPPDGVAETAADAAVGVGSGAAMGFDDEIAGALSALANLDTSKYQGARDEYRQRKELASTRSPWANGLGQAAGAIGTTLATGGAGDALAAGRAGEGAVGLGKILKAGSSYKGWSGAGRLAAEGAVQGAGDTDVAGTAGAGDLAAGAGLGGAVGVVAGKAVGGVTGKLGRLFRGEGVKAAQEGADRALVRQAYLNPEEVAKNPGGITRQAATMREQGIGKGLANAAETKGQADEAIKALSAARSEIAGKAKVPVEGSDVAPKIRDLWHNQATVGDEGAGRRAYLERYEADLKHGVGTEAQPRQFSFDKAKANLDAAGDKTQFSEGSPGAQLRKGLYASWNDAMSTALDKGDPGAGQDWRKAGVGMQGAIEASDAAGAQAVKDENRGMVPSLLKHGLAIGGGHMVGGPVGAGVALAAEAATKGRGRAIQKVFAEGNVKAQTQAAKYLSPLGRALHGTTKGAATAARQAGVARVQQAAQQSPEDAAQAHYVESLTNPDYREATHQEDNP